MKVKPCPGSFLRPEGKRRHAKCLREATIISEEPKSNAMPLLCLVFGLFILMLCQWGSNQPTNEDTDLKKHLEEHLKRGEIAAYNEHLAEFAKKELDRQKQKEH